ncbi:MAG TPA: hypothetical protein VN958_04340, partial [Chitinophagaceae bacterium]|nr:hypothetical protein [Chitinophagaceae bacterium]
RYALGFLKEDEVHKVDVLCGAFLMAEKSTLLQLDGFDEAFFMYGEDIDLCYRIQKTRNKIYYLGNATIVHFKGESTKKSSFNYVRVFYQAMNVFVKKHYTGSSAWLIKILLHAGIYAGAAASLIASPFKHQKKISEKGAVKKSILLIGDPISSAEAADIIKHNMHEPMIKKLQSLHSLPQQTDELSEMVFCTGWLSYKDTIRLVIKEKNNYKYKWHGLHTKSIVGSAEKKFTGEVYSLKEV